MTTLSEPTLGLLVQIAVDAFTHDELQTLLLRADLQQQQYLDYGLGGSGKHGLVRQRLYGARQIALDGDREAHRSLLTFTRMLLERRVSDPEDPPTWLPGLRESLLGDGYQITYDRTVEMVGYNETVTVSYQILPTDSGPAPLANEISALERELTKRGYTDAINHYQQAVSNFSLQQYEAANGQLRTMLEALVMGFAKKNGYAGQSRAGDGNNAINHLVTTGALPERDGGLLLRGLWQITHTNGSHPGQSTADEARIRMQLVTATARFLLNHFPP